MDLLPLLEGTSSGEAEEAIKKRLQNLEKELFFYKHCSRKLRKQLKESQCADQSPQAEETLPELNGSKDPKRFSRQQSPSSSSSSAENAKPPAEHQIGAIARCHGYSERRPPPPHGSRATVGLRRRKLRDLAGPARDSVVDTGIEMLSDDSLEASTGSETPEFVAMWGQWAFTIVFCYYIVLRSGQDYCEIVVILWEENLCCNTLI